jgi:hypothetical protein
MARVAALLVLALSLSGCDMISTLIDGYKYAKAVETDLEASTLPELAETVRHAVTSHFKQTPGDIVLGFSLGKSGSGTIAQLRMVN